MPSQCFYCLFISLIILLIQTKFLICRVNTIQTIYGKAQIIRVSFALHPLQSVLPPLIELSGISGWLRFAHYLFSLHSYIAPLNEQYKMQNHLSFSVRL